MFNKDTARGTLTVTAVLCVACSIVVSIAAVTLRPSQHKNREQDKVRNILAAAGLLREDADVLQVFRERIKPQAIDLETGDYTDHIDAAIFDIKKNAKSPQDAMRLPRNEDIAQIKMRPRYSVVYEVVGQGGGLEQVVLPIYGMGLWSTLWGFIAIDADGNTIRGLEFFDHAETPGLGGEVDNPQWKKQWQGKRIRDPEGGLAITVLKGKVQRRSPNASYQVDGLSGATLTTNGVSNLVRYWLDEQGYGKYLARLRKGGSSRG
jgi:Na+-transporting NADH:ubiquinone oxidoreductase subunit C